MRRCLPSGRVGPGGLEDRQVRRGWVIRRDGRRRVGRRARVRHPVGPRVDPGALLGRGRNQSHPWPRVVWTF